LVLLSESSDGLLDVSVGELGEEQAAIKRMKQTNRVVNNFRFNKLLSPFIIWNRLQFNSRIFRIFKQRDER
jgi:hypothetical protein